MADQSGIFASLRHRDYLLFWSGSFISNIGTWLQATALLWYVKEYTGSNAWVGLVNLANFIPVFLFILPAGYLADTRDRKKLVLAGFWVMMGASMTLGVLASLEVARLPVILSFVFITGTAYTFCLPAGNTLLPDLVSKEEMLNAVALSSAQYNLGRVIGPALGGLVIASLAVSAAFYINAASFLVIIALVMLVRTEFPPRVKDDRGMFPHIREGLSYARRRRWMLAILAALGLATFFGYACTVLYPALARDVLDRGAGAYGLLLSCTGIGAAAGAPLVTLLNRRLAERVLIAASVSGLGLFVLGLSLSRTYWLSCLMAMGIGCCYLVLGSCVNTVLQARSLKEMRGRVVSLYSMLGLGMFPLGGMFLGWLADAKGSPYATRLGGIACLGLAALLWMLPALTREADSRLGPD